MGNATLVIMAAGIGSRYGGAKQIVPVGPCNERIIDYSLYDAWMAGFDRVVFIINHELEADFREVIGDPISHFMDVDYSFQEIGRVPEGYPSYPDRKKPWGTCEAVLGCRELIDGPFAVINADDYYGRHAFALIKDAMDDMAGQTGQYAMVGYHLGNTLTENGHVARGICVVEDGMLKEVTERTHIEKRGDGAEFTEDDGLTWTYLPHETPVSMNFWAFTPDIFPHLDTAFRYFLDHEVQQNPLKIEKYLPNVVGDLLKSGEASVRVMQSPDHWYGVTYKADTPSVVNALAHLTDEGVYNKPLWPQE